MSPEITQHLSKDPTLARLIETMPERVSSESQGLYSDLLGSIISQQLSTKVAQVIEGRFLALFEGGYPHPDKVLAFDIPTLRSVGLSNQKASYIQNVARFFTEEKLLEKNWDDVPNEEIIRQLTQIKGVGKWTVEMILMFTLRRPDVLPLDDFGIYSAIAELYNLAETGKALKAKMTEIAEPWRPYRSYACFYLWRYKDSK